MRLPKRSVFHRPHEEISHLYTLFYPNSLHAAQADAARRRGVDLVHRVYLSRSSSPCPVAIECTAALVDALLLDAALSPSIGGASGSAVRSALSLSLIRLVNSLADSLQQGVYAKSIAAIAERQLGLPQSFVEFRHRATHEDLPSLTVCREAAIAAVSWLQINYWIPTLQALDLQSQGHAGCDLQQRARHDSERPPIASTSSVVDLASQRASASASLEAILNSYRRLAKAIARDQSLRKRNRASLQDIFRELDAWRQRTDALLPRLEDPDEDDSGEEDEGDDEDEEQAGRRWSSDAAGNEQINGAQLSAADGLLLTSLLKPGVGIVPLAKSKRPKRNLALSEDIKQTWEYLFEAQPKLRGQLVEHIVKALTDGADAAEEDEEEPPLLSRDASYARTLQAWLLHLIDADGEEDVVRRLMASLLAGRSNAPAKKSASSTLPAILALLSRRKERGENTAQLENLVALVQRREQDETAAVQAEEEPLLKGFEDMGGSAAAQAVGALQVDDEVGKESQDLDTLLTLMEQRRLAAFAPPQPPPPRQEGGPEVDMQVDDSDSEDDDGAEGIAHASPPALPPGWSLPSKDEWQPTPIGCLAGQVPDFFRLTTQANRLQA
ncbi:Las1-domain-containing protein [Jaminaea rosea]|uniref:Las1-domain-containing protein n=1 Tax=Jaminaea rosea TaxID=1569628 RepID=A0A316UNW5_9BASI|nr:Las1-domain-containing protein [Jaminaea rosea]PWN26976.1 Las1-domain-containing protein [Jaminaea rosea]